MKQKHFGKMILPDKLESSLGQIMALAGHQLLDENQEKALIQQLVREWPDRKAGSEPPPKAKHIMDELILKNFRLVVSVAKKYQGRGLELPDLINTGILGLHRGICKFDPMKGTRLSTYTTPWIHQVIRRAIADQQGAIRRPVHFQDKARAVGLAIDELERAGRQVTREALLDALGDEWTADKLAEYEQLYAQSTTESLDELAFADGEMSGHGVIADDGPPLESLVEQDALAEKMKAMLETLEPRETKILELRFGLNGYGGQPHTLQEVGEKFGITRERVRQIQGEALKKLRHPRRARQLREFLG